MDVLVELECTGNKTGGGRHTIIALTAKSFLRSIQKAQVAIHLFPSLLAIGRMLSCSNSLNTGP